MVIVSLDITEGMKKMKQFVLIMFLPYTVFSTKSQQNSYETKLARKNVGFSYLDTL